MHPRPPRVTTVLSALTLPALVTALTLSPTSVNAEEATPGFQVQDGRLVDANGDDFVMRGVNHPHAWFPQKTTDSLNDIASLGANTVRVVLSSGDQWDRVGTSEVAGIVSQCRDNGLVCVLEVHDTTGYGEDEQAVSLDRAVDYWTSVQDAVHGAEDNVIINIGNEPHGNTNHEEWTADTTGAVERMRAEGFEHALMVDAPNWGQDWSSTMRDNASSVLAADPDDNTVFSVHMYGVYEEASDIDSYMSSFVDAQLPLVVGEFGHDHSDGNPDEDAILAAAEKHGIGYLGWSWSGNSSGVAYLDMATDFNSDHLTSWGERIFHGENGIAETAQRAAVP